MDDLSTFRPCSIARRRLGWPLALVALALLPSCVAVPADHHRNLPVVAPPPIVVAPPAPQVLNVRLYPVNAEANRIGMLAAIVVDKLNGHGSFTLNYDGRVMQGEASRVASDTPVSVRIERAHPAR